MISCKSSSTANLSDGGNGNYNSATLVANANKDMKTPVPAAVSCPEGELKLRPKDFSDESDSMTVRKAEAEKYVGCTFYVTDKLIEVHPTSVVLIDNVQNFAGKEKVVYCQGSFSSEIYSKIGQKLSGLEKDRNMKKFPYAQFSGKVKQVEGTSKFELTECVMVKFIG